MSNLVLAILGTTTVGAIATAVIAWIRYRRKDAADTRLVEAETEERLSNIARGLLDEQRGIFDKRINHLEQQVKDLIGQVAEQRTQIQGLVAERDVYKKWARSLEKQVRDLGGHPVPLSRWLNGD